MNIPEMIPVSSSNIESIGYDEPNQQVYVRFLNGSLYIYKGVPIHEFDNLKTAPSSFIFNNVFFIFEFDFLPFISSATEP